MKSSLKKIGSLIAVCLLSLTFGAQAVTLFQDNFDSYPTGDLTNSAPGVWIAHSGINPINVVLDSAVSAPNALQVSQSLAQDVHVNLDTNKTYADITVTNTAITFTTNIVVGVSTNITSSTNITFTYAFSPSNSVPALYAKFTIYVTTIPSVASSSQTYFTHFYTGSGGFVDKVFIVTNGAVSGSFRIAVQNSGNAVTNTIPLDLTPNTAYTIVSRYAMSAGASKIWVNPVNETSGNSAVPLDSPATGNIMAYAYRQSTGEGIVDVDNLVVGTSFADVVPGSVNPPTFVTQPQDNTTPFVGGSVSFTNLAVGDPTIKYQWYYNTNTLLTNNSFSVSGATNRLLTMTNLTVAQSGIYSCVVSNAAGTNVTRFATLFVNSIPIPPTITNQPVSITNIVGDVVTFSVVAGGSQPLVYLWKVDNGTVTNNVVGGIASGTNTATLTLSGITASLSGLKYFVTITNQFGVTNSAKATLTVNPIVLTNIAALHAQIDPVTFAPSNTTSLYKVRGIVTTWSDMTGVANTLFYLQDGTGGIPIFWQGASGTTNLPPPGALVEVVGPLTSFSGLLEIQPVFTNTLHSVTIISTNTPASIPKAQPLVFDPLLLANTAIMKQLEGSYFVASNVFLVSGGSFSGNVNEGITNIATQTKSFTNSILNLTYTNGAGQPFTFFINASTDISGNTRPSGPVTVYGILGYHTPEGFEFTASRFADIISYVHMTNVLVNARKGDLATNSYPESVVRLGELLTTYVSIGDAAGGVVTLTPAGPLPTGATWSSITSGTTATAVFNYTGNAADAGNNFLIQLNVTSTAGTSYAQTFSVYVPTAQEQKIAITEFLTTPTTNPASAFYNPLARATVVNGISTNDQYVEIVNQSDTDIDSLTKFTLDTGSASSPVYSSFDGAGTALLSSNSLVIYGGKGTGLIPPGLSTPFDVSRSGLFLKASGGVLVLRNASGYIMDRITYSAGDVSTNGSTSRFPTWTSAIVPQTYISTNLVTPGSQYDGGPWNASSKVPTGVTGVTISYVNGAAVLNFTADTTQASTLWDSSEVSGPYSVIFGKPFPTGVGTFTNVNSASKQFYYISTQ